MLYGQDQGESQELLRARFGAFARCSLRVNCRNSPRVAELSHLLGKLDPNYSRVLRPDDRIEPAISYYATPSQQRKELVNILERLHRESFSADDIVILSPKAGPLRGSGSHRETLVRAGRQRRAGCGRPDQVHNHPEFQGPRLAGNCCY